jgi:ribosomal protein L11 methylase PrmA
MAGGYNLNDDARPLLIPFCPGRRWPRSLDGWRVAQLLSRPGLLGSLVDALSRYLVALHADGREAVVGTLADRRVGPWMDVLRSFVSHGHGELQVLPALAVQGPRPATLELDEQLCVISTATPRKVDESTILLDAHLAFGSGLHPTTRLCARVLREIDAQPAALDVGCGSGILTLVAARCRSSVVAVDRDPYARAVCRYNLDANDLRVRVLARLPNNRFPLLIANLWPDALDRLADVLKSRLLPGGLLVASGGHDEDMARIIPKLYPLRPLSVLSSDGWGALLLKAP